MIQRFVMFLLLIPILLQAGFEQYVTRDNTLMVTPENVTLDQIENPALINQWGKEFASLYGGDWKILIDVRSGVPAHVYNGGIPMIPGSANQLPYSHQYSKGQVINLVMDFFTKHASLFGVDLSQVRCNNATKIDNKWYLSFNRYHNNIKVQGSSALASLVGGNLYEFGFTKWANISVDTTPTINAEEALAMLFSILGGQDPYLDSIINPGTLIIIPTSTDNSLSQYQGTIGSGYAHKLAWSFTFIRGEDGPWKASVDAHTGVLLSFHKDDMTSLHRASVTGKIYNHSINAEGHVYAGPYGMPYADIRERYNCYQSSNFFCEAHSPIAYGQKPSLCYTSASGIYKYDDQSSMPYSDICPKPAKGYQTRLYGDKVYIYQTSRIHDTDPVCQDGNIKHTLNSYLDDTFLCSHPTDNGDASDVEILLGGIEGFDGDWCQQSNDPCPWCSDNTESEACGNNNAARTAYYHANYFKDYWGSNFLCHSSSPSNASICNWVEDQLQIRPNWGTSGSQYWYLGGGSTEYLQLSRDYYRSNDYGDASFNNDSLFPSTLYHEMGHGLEVHRRTDDDDDSPVSSKETFSDIIAALMTQDSCIGRGSIEYNTGAVEHSCPYGSRINTGQDHDECIAFAGDNFPVCNGFRDINHLHHTSQMKYTPQNFIQYYCEEDDPDTPDPEVTNFGPCGRQAHCESQIASQAFWEMRGAFEDYYEGCGYSSFRAKRMSWHKAKTLFVHAISQLDQIYYNCDLITDSSDGSSANSLFNRLLSADIDSGPSTHYKEIFEAFNNHNIATAPDPYSFSECPTTPEDFEVVATPNFNTILLSWEPAQNIQLYRIYRSQLGPDTGFILLSSTYSSSYVDEAVSNTMTYWYRVIPIEANTYDFGAFGEVGPISPSGGLLVLPDPPADDFDDNPLYFSTNRTKIVQLNAYGGFGEYTWSELTGNLPSWLTLDPIEGTITGTPDTSGTPFTVTIQATDTNAPTLTGTRDYQVKVMTGNSGSLRMQIYYLHPSTVNTLYDVDLQLLGATGYHVEVSEGELPQGLYFINPHPGEWHIQGTPTPDQIGLHVFTISVSATVGDFIFNIDRTFYLAVMDQGQSVDNNLVATPVVGSTVGGKTIQLYYTTTKELSTGLGSIRFIDNDAACDSSSAYIEQRTYSVLEQHQEQTSWGSYHVYILEAETPPLPEGTYHIAFKRPVSTTCSDTKFSANVFAFTSNSITDDVSVIDTTENQVFDLDTEQSGIQRMTLQEGTIPWGMALSKTPKDSTELYVVDYGTGNVQVYDAVNYEYMTTIALQDPNAFFFHGLGAVDVDVDSQGYAYVVHTTSGLQQQPGFPYPIWNPIYGSISVIDTDTKTLIDTDPDDPRFQLGWIPGFHRIGTPGLYPYSISILRRDPAAAQYDVGDGYPGEYAFISGVGRQDFTPIDWVPIACTDGINYFHCIPGPPYCACPPGWQTIYEPVYGPRPLVVGILDLNREKVQEVLTDGTVVRETNMENYWTFRSVEDIGTDGRRMGISNQGLDFDVHGDSADATVFAVSPTENKVYDFKFKEAVNNPITFDYHSTDLINQDRPVDVSVVDVNGIPLAFIANAGSDSITVMQSTEVEGEYPFVVDTIDISEASCEIPTNYSYYGNRGPIAIETRSKGDYGYTASYLSGTLTKIDLQNFSCLGDVILDETENVGPRRLAIQPVNTILDFYQNVKTAIVVAPDTAFTQAPKKDALVKEWKIVNDLQETSADSTAVLVNIDNFQRNVNKWITDEEVKADVTQGVQLYRTAYLMNVQ